MDTCTNCGAQLRAGAKFCTTCGARQNPKAESNNGWSEQPTQIIPAVQLPSEPEPDENPSDSGWPASSQSRSSDDPASRFISALESNMKPVEDDTSETPEPEPKTTEDSWRSAFSPPQATNWNWSAPSTPEANEQTQGTDQSAEPSAPAADNSDADTSTDSTWSSWSIPAPASPRDNAGFTEDGTDEVDYLSGDENIEVSGPETPRLVEDVINDSPETPIHLNPHPVVVPDSDLSADDARDRAIALVDELRSVIRQMSGTPADTGNAAMMLTEATLNVDGFDDVREVLAAVAQNPRDISALSDLAGKVDRLQALLADRDVLVDTIERALADLTGN